MNQLDNVRSGIRIINRAVLEARALTASELIIVDDNPITVSLSIYHGLTNYNDYQVTVSPAVSHIMASLNINLTDYGLILVNHLLSKLVVTKNTSHVADNSRILIQLKDQLENLVGMGYSVEAIALLGIFGFTGASHNYYPTRTPYPSPVEMSQSPSRSLSPSRYSNQVNTPYSASPPPRSSSRPIGSTSSVEYGSSSRSRAYY